MAGHMSSISGLCSLQSQNQINVHYIGDGTHTNINLRCIDEYTQAHIMQTGVSSDFSKDV